MLFLLWNCTPQSSNIKIDEKAIEVELSPQNDTLKLSDLFKLHKLIVFDSLFLSDLVEVQIMDSIILVQSKSKNEDLHLFDNNGKYIKSFVSYGRAQNEILNIQSFCFNRYTNTIDVLCNYGMEVKQYSYPGGELYNQIAIPTEEVLSVADFEILDSTSYMFYKNLGFCNKDEYKLYRYDYVDLKVRDKFLKLDKDLAEKISIGQHNNLYMKNSNLYFYETFLDGVYAYNQDSLDIRKRILFKPNKFSIPDKKLKQMGRDELEFIEECRESNYIWAHVNCVEFQDKIFSYFTYNKRVYFNIIDLNEKMSSSYLYIYDDILSHQCYSAGYFSVIGCSDNYLVCTIEPYSIKFDRSYILLLEKNEIN